MVEHAAVNRRVVGSSPTRGANPDLFCRGFYLNRSMNVKEFECGPVFTKTYVVFDERTQQGILIDAPPDSARSIVPFVRESKIQIQNIVLTHGHWDHIADALQLRRELCAPVLYHKLDEPLILSPMESSLVPPFRLEGCPADRFIDDGEILSIGDISFKILFLPGHSEGHIGLFEFHSLILFSGDVIFKESIGRTDLPGGDHRTLIHSIFQSIWTLPENSTIYPGHGPRTTLQYERRNNPFLRVLDSPPEINK